jgi:hypothetical protein
VKTVAISVEIASSSGMISMAKSSVIQSAIRMSCPWARLMPRASSASSATPKSMTKVMLRFSVISRR